MSYSVWINEPVGGMTDRTSYVDIGDSGGGQSFQMSLGQRGSGSLVFVIRAGDTYLPTVGSPIFVKQGSQTVFAGTIDSTENSWLGNKGDFTCSLSLVSLEAYFDNILIPPRSYISKTAGYIVADLLSSVCSDVPVTAGTITAGPTIDLITYAWDSVSSAFDALATAASFAWRVDPATQTLEFTAPSLQAAPFTLTGANTIWESMDWTKTRQDYRNSQVYRLSFACFPPSNHVFGPGFSTYDVNWPIDNIKEAFLTTSVRAAVAWTMHSIPTAGDTVTVGSAVYTWVAALDNTQEFEILIGASTGTCSAHLQHAIDADPTYAGIEFSLPTWENGLFNGGELPLSFSTTAWVKVPGAAGNAYPVASSNTGSLSWATATATGGVDGTNTILQVGISGTTGNDLTYEVGKTTITLTSAVVSYLSVVYWRIGGDCIAVRNDAMIAARAAIEHSDGVYQMLNNDSQETVLQNGLTNCRAALSTYSNLPITFSFYTDSPNLRPGLWLAINYTGPGGMGTLLNGNWLIQEVDASLLAGSQVWRYQVYVVNATVVNYLNFWLNLIGAGGGGTGGVAMASLPGPAPPEPSPPSPVPTAPHAVLFTEQGPRVLQTSDQTTYTTVRAVVQELIAGVLGTELTLQISWDNGTSYETIGNYTPDRVHTSGSYYETTIDVPNILCKTVTQDLKARAWASNTYADPGTPGAVASSTLTLAAIGAPSASAATLSITAPVNGQDPVSGESVSFVYLTVQTPGTAAPNDWFYQPTVLNVDSSGTAGGVVRGRDNVETPFSEGIPNDGLAYTIPLEITYQAPGETATYAQIKVYSISRTAVVATPVNAWQDPTYSKAVIWPSTLDYSRQNYGTAKAGVYTAKDVSQNGDFSQLVSGVPVYWTLGSDWSSSTADFHSGTRSIKCAKTTTGNSNTADSAKIPCDVTQYYSVSFWVNGASSFFVPKLTIEFFNSGGSSISTLIAYQAPIFSSGWTKCAGTPLVPPTGAVTMRMHIEIDIYIAGGPAYIDDIVLTPLVTPDQMQIAGPLFKDVNKQLNVRIAGGLVLDANNNLLPGVVDIAKAINYDVTNFQLGGTVGSSVTTLSSAVTTTTETLFYVASGASITNGSYYKIDSEVVQVTSGGGAGTLAVLRGMSGTTAATHSSGATVYAFTPVMKVKQIAVDSLIAGTALFLGTATFAYDTNKPYVQIGSAGLTLADNWGSPTCNVTLTSSGVTLAQGSNSVQVTASGITITGPLGSLVADSGGVAITQGSIVCTAIATTTSLNTSSLLGDTIGLITYTTSGAAYPVAIGPGILSISETTTTNSRIRLVASSSLSELTLRQPFSIGASVVKINAASGMRMYDTSGNLKIQMDVSGTVQISNLPSSSPGAGTKQLWYDSVTLAVKFAA